MRLRSTLYSLLLLTGLASAQTYIAGATAGLWGYDSQPYILSANAVVGARDTLRIAENVFVDLNHFELRIEGVLIATGAQWGNGGSLFGSGGHVFLTDCEFEGLTGGIKIYSGRAEIQNCLINNTAETGITFNGSDSSFLDNNVISNSGDYGVKIRATDDIVFVRNILSGNSTNDFNHPALFIDSASPETIQYNIIENNHGQGIGVWSLSSISQPAITNNIIRRNFTGITLVNAPIFLENNIIVANFQEGNSNSGAGIYAGYSNSNPIIMGNYIAGNYYGVSNINGATCNLGDLVNDYPGDDGLNIFANNMVEGVVWNIWNSNSAQLLAQNNYWPGLDIRDIDATLWDDEEGGGEILFEPISVTPLPSPPDVNADININILDAVVLVENLMAPGFSDPITFYLSDINHDYYLNIEDVVALVELIIED